VIEQNEAIHDLPQEGKARHQEIVREWLRQPKSQLKKRRVTIKMEEFKEKCDKDRAANKLQARAGAYEITPITSEDKIPFGVLVMACNLENVLHELEFRELSTEGRWHDDLIPRLKENENDTKNFLPRCPCVDFHHVWEYDALKKRNVEE
jgi:hypothetical protein